MPNLLFVKLLRIFLIVLRDGNARVYEKTMGGGETMHELYKMKEN